MSEITPEDIENKFKDVASQVDTVTETSKAKALFGGVIASAIILLVTYLLGRKSGRRKTSVMEIRRM